VQRVKPRVAGRPGRCRSMPWCAMPPLTWAILFSFVPRNAGSEEFEGVSMVPLSRLAAALLVAAGLAIWQRSKVKQPRLNAE